ncbi:restin homolog isoform X2 [Mercenaria mercenaria]|uniref:restin homolog isoform X2 n=1 Tax=Mercenaria mercenaria TaxID=6596 RepID=UPI00234E82BE|nr:restin homolog isoform X2 [Mercenaria mercenaria]
MTATGPATGGSERNVKKKVHFEETWAQKNQRKKLIKGSKKKSAKSKDADETEDSNAQAVYEVETSSKDGTGKASVRKMVDVEKAHAKKMKDSHPQAKSRKREGDVGGKSVARASSTSKMPKGDGKKNWQFVNLRDEVKRDMFSVTKRVMEPLNTRQNLVDSKPFSSLDIEKSVFLPTRPLYRRALSSHGLNSDYEALMVLSAIEEQQKKRHQEHLQSQLEVIQKRVRKTLEDYGIESDSEEDEDALKLPPIFDNKSERKKMQERNYVIDLMDTFEEKALVKKQYLTEVMFWFDHHLNMFSDLVTQEEMKEMIQVTHELHQVIRCLVIRRPRGRILSADFDRDSNSPFFRCEYCKSLHVFIKNGEQVVEKGKMLLAETSKIIKERKAQMSKRTRKERIVVYEDKALLSDPLKWESAAKTIISVFEDSHKMIKNLMFKNAIRLCQKQFDYMMVVCDKRFKELEEKKKQCHDLQGKLHSAKMQSDKLNREIEEQKKKFTKQSQELFDTKQALEKLQERNKELNSEVMELNSKIQQLEGELELQNRTPTPPPTPPEPEYIFVKTVDSSTELKLREVEEELENAKREIERILAELNEINEKFQAEQEKNKLLQERVTELEKLELIEPVTPVVEPPVIDTRRASDREMERILAELNEINEKFQAQQEKNKLLQERVTELEKLELIEPVTPVVEPPVIDIRRALDMADKDVNYYKTLMSGMKKEFEVEMEKVKSHVRKEKTRGDANIKKLEYQHKDQLSAIRKDTVRMLRGIMHFRYHMLKCLEKENLLDQAQALHDLGDIVKDKLSPDPKEVLVTIVGTVVDYLHKMEGILGNSFLAMRLLMKYQIDKQVEAEVQQRMAEKEIQKKAREMKGPKKNVNSLAKSLKKAKNKLKKAKQNTANFSSDRKYLDLLSRYNGMMKLYTNMQKEMEVLQSDFHDAMQKKLQEKETMVISQIKMEMKQKRALAEEQLKMSTADQRQNLKMLSVAYEQNKISKDLHMLHKVSVVEMASCTVMVIL